MNEGRFDSQEMDMSKLHTFVQISMILVFKKPLYYMLLITWLGEVYY
jgi:hypothetical protein